MLVYLDHAHFVALDILRKREPAKFAEFLAFWLERECQMVVSRAHLHEIGQSETPRDVENKLAVLQYFSLWSSPLEENVDWVLAREIRNQTLHRLESTGDALQPRSGQLRAELYLPVDHEELRNFVRRNRAGWMDERRVRGEVTAFENRSRALRKQFQQWTGKKQPKWDPEGWKLLRTVRRTIPQHSGGLVADRWNADVDARAEECYKNSKRKREALICMYDLKGLSAFGRAPEEDLSRHGFMRAWGRHCVQPECLQTYGPDETAAALNAFDPYAAPAISLSLAVERGRKTDDKEYEPSDYVDVDHLLWAAYSDLMFVDKRTFGFLHQAKSNSKTAKLISPHVPSSIQRTGNLEDARRQIAARAEELHSAGSLADGSHHTRF